MTSALLNKNLRDARAFKERSSVGSTSIYIIVASQEWVASYFWNGKQLSFICSSQFSAALEESRKVVEVAGRRKSGKHGHKQGLQDSERHSSNIVGMVDLMRLHLDSLRASITSKGLPLLFSKEITVICDSSNRASIKSAFGSRKSLKLNLLSHNLIGRFENFQPAKPKVMKEILSLLSER